MMTEEEILEVFRMLRIETDEQRKAVLFEEFLQASEEPTYIFTTDNKTEAYEEEE